MRPLTVMVVAPDADARGALERTVRRLGHVPVASEPAAVGSGLPPLSDVVVVDAREPRGDWDQLSGIGRPLVLVVDGPRQAAALAGLADAVMVDAADRDAGFRVALGVCSALAALVPAVT